MIFVFHGPNQPKLRNEFVNLKKGYEDVKFWEEELVDLVGYLSLQSLFGGRELVVLENPKVADAVKFSKKIEGKRVEKDVVMLFSEGLNRQKLAKFKDADIREFRDDIPKNVFPLLDAILARQKQKALSETRRLLSQGNDLGYLLKMFSWQLRNLARVKGGVTAGINPYVVKKLSRFKKSWSDANIQEALSLILKADLKLKKGKKNPVEFLVDKITSL